MVNIIGSGDDAVKTFAKECLEKGGIPTFVPEYAGIPLKYGGKPAVIARCYLQGEPLRGGLITDISEDLWKKIKEARRDVRALAKELGVARELGLAKE